MARRQTTHRFTTRRRLSSSLGLQLSYRRLDRAPLDPGANDRAEAAAIARDFGARTVPVTSLKGAIGHCMGASGLFNLLAATSAFDDVPRLQAVRYLARRRGLAARGAAVLTTSSHFPATKSPAPESENPPTYQPKNHHSPCKSMTPPPAISASKICDAGTCKSVTYDIQNP